MTNNIQFNRSSEPKPTSLRMPFMNFSRTFAALSAASLTVALIGCSSGMPANTTAPITPTQTKTTITGRAMGGQSAIVGANIYLFAVGATGYGSASTSLLQAGASTTLDSGGGATNGDYYATTDSNGNFGITGDYTCPNANSLIYLVSVGGNAGSGSNPALYIMSALGNCNTVLGAANSEFFTVNEVTTVASVYALAPYMTLSGTLGASATHIGAPATTAGLAGITNAFAEVPNVVSLSLGGALSATPAGNGVVPANLINALANAVAYCVNSNGGSSTCSGSNQLLALTTVNSITPLDTIAATLSIAQNPGHSVTGIVNNDSYVGAPFSTTLTTANDLTMSVAYTGTGISTPQGVAIDGSGNAWVVNAGSPNTVVGLAAATGSALTGGSGYTGGSLDAPVAVAVDTTGNVWVANCGGACSGDANASSVSYLTVTSGSITGSSNLTGGALTGSYGISLDGTNRAFIANSLSTAVSAFNSTGTVAGSAGYTATYQSNTTAAAVDTAGNVWTVSPTSNAVTEFTPSSGDTTPFTAGANTYVGSGVAYPFAIAIDASNRQWVVDQSSNKVSVLSAGAPIGASPFSLGGLSTPNGIALDGVGTAWISNANGSISAFTTAGTAVTLATGFKPGGTYANGIAVDGSGTIWVTDCGSYCGGTGPGTVYQVIGAAAPVVTPIAYGVANSQLATRP